ncbi:hypothetical protein FUA26_10420 [Seonamhaeicola algicola]|uniref:Uncharacterized protein n=1 Tax=Seonamhaeicola algicola TaxID=1719036 RepID=A0A5C7AW07_9FLAO|nr:hypothetical protein [Seonamhaeicola algicola]TXE09892.1 hypothetical protein FUA26_10420 [Seonamhaeicola algicola]
MKTLKTVITALLFTMSFSIYAQNSEDTAKNASVDKMSYYEKRAKEDAKFEQKFKAENTDEEESFWEEQKAYEKELKKRDKKAYRAYIRGKRDAYAEHYEHCDSHCHHGHHYYNHASFYYYRYDGYYYKHPNRGTSINTNVRLRTPRISVGLF